MLCVKDISQPFFGVIFLQMGRKRRRQFTSSYDGKKRREYLQSLEEKKFLAEQCQLSSDEDDQLAAPPTRHRDHLNAEPQPGPSWEPETSIDHDHSYGQEAVPQAAQADGPDEVCRVLEPHEEEDDPGANPYADIPPQHNRRRPREQIFKARQFPPVVQTFSLGKMDQKCIYCGALYFRGENVNCCHKGKVELPPLAPYPQEFRNLLTSHNAQSTHFQDQIRQYNSSMAFASFVGGVSPRQGRGPYTFRLHGQLYHRAGSLHPLEGQTPSYSQLYIIEGEQAVETHLANKHNEKCQRDIMVLLATVLERVSPFAAAYKYMHEVEQQQLRIAAENGVEPPEVTMYFKRGHDRRRYNEPRHDEVAAVFVSNDGAPPTDRDVVVHPKNAAPRDIPFLSSNIDPMTYPILFPHGEYGWKSQMSHNAERASGTRNVVTMLQFYAHRLAVRELFSPIFYGGKLFQQYVVDAYLRVEANNLNYIKQNQTKLRVDSYQGLMDHLQTRAENEDKDPGKMVILPSSFKGSPRAMQQHYQDAMAIVAKYGKPDLFLTFTCNPKCKDIVDNLLPGQQAIDRPDIVARVFKLHLEELMKDIKQRHVLGVPVAHIYVIEYQKRGLPHAHLLIILADGSKLRLPVDIDSLIHAEIPNAAEHPALYEVVKTTMVHGPCGHLKPSSPCMENGQCTKDFPKSGQNATVMTDNGYPNYRRRKDGPTIAVKISDTGIVEVDNTFIVPYNPYLSLKFCAHINLEACTSVKSVKYLFKYVYKGHDCANLEVTESSNVDHGDNTNTNPEADNSNPDADNPNPNNETQKDKVNHDEVKQFLDARYISAPEAFWRLYAFKMSHHSHTVIRLALHLSDQHPVFFTPGNEELAAEASARKDTTLTAFFKYNAEHHTDLCYKEFPTQYVFNKQTSKWTPRKQRGETTIGRLYSASPKDMERFCLRLLLHHVPGPTCYKDLRTVNGHTVETFKEACVLLHLLDDDSEWDNTLREASAFQMPRQLRSLFATICLHCSPTDPLQLWENHKEALMEDFTHANYNAQVAEQLALHHIESLLQTETSCAELGLPEIQPIEQPERETEFDPATEAQEADECIALLNEKQRSLVDSVCQDLISIRNGEDLKCRAYFLDGPGGSGKTMCYNTLISWCRGHRIKVASSAWTGIAATLLKGGRTCHNLFKLPVPILDTSVCHVTPTSKHADFLRSVSMFIIDEASMVPAHALRAIDTMLRDITSLPDVPFGGRVFLLGGDFRQVLPVVPRQPRTVIVENCLKSSPLWPLFNVVKLTKNMRTDADQQEFARWLLQLGNGNLKSQASPVPDLVEIPPQCNVACRDIIDDIFNDMSAPHAMANTVVLTPKNATALQLNDKVLKDKVPGELKTYISADKVICDDEEEANNYPLEFANSLTPTGMPPHRLLLKKGAIVMLLRNLDVTKGLCNGTRLIVHNLHEHVIDAEIITGSCKGHRVLIPRIKLAPSDTNLPFTLQRTQFPLRLSYCMTINKAQGQTFDKLGIFLPDPVFAHGQLYVAFSRARCFQNVYIKMYQTPTQGLFGTKHLTKNVVYTEVLE